MPAFTEPLASDGAVVRVEVGVSSAQRQQLFAARRPVPQPALFTALIDTGAEVTCVDSRAASRLQLPRRRAMLPVNAPSAGGQSFTVFYNARLTVLHPSGNPTDHLNIPDIVVADLSLNSFGIDLLLGRDVLALCRFNYDGPADTFSLSY
jgi:hypothetical protein